MYANFYVRNFQSYNLYIACSSICSTNPLSLLLANIFEVVKKRFQEFCTTIILQKRCQSDVDTKNL